MAKMVKLFKALSEEVRLRILHLLSNGELCVCDLMTVLDLPQSTISRHLSYLNNAGWVKSKRRGVWMYYRLTEDGDSLQQDLLNVLMKHRVDFPEIDSDHKKLTQYLATKDKASCG